jgi:Concanavalin A-like lectin/glucanases superfamily/Bacterial Ig-like domain/Calcineurin-like phosphoesterase
VTRRKTAVRARATMPLWVAAAAMLVAALLMGEATASAPPSYLQEVMADSPAGYWRMGDGGPSAADASGHGNQGGYLNGVALGLPGALATDADTAAGFDGGNDLMSVPDPASGQLDVGTADFTAEAWIRPLANDERPVVGKRDASRSWQVTVSDDPNHAGQLRANVNDGTVVRQAYSVRRVDDGGWHHIAVRFDRDSGIGFFIDGRPAGGGSGAMTGDLGNAASLQVGKLPDYPNFKGEIDEVAVYRSLLAPGRIEAHYVAHANDDITPQLSLVAPSTGTATDDATPTFTGTAGNALGDEPTVTVEIHAGFDLSGALVESFTAARLGDGTYSQESASLGPGTYTAQAHQADRARNVGQSDPTTFTVLEGATALPASPVVLAAGDIAGCGGSTTGEAQTAAIIEGLPGATVLSLGDHAYPNGTAADFTDCYGPTWGRFKPRTRPVPGGHDYLTPGAAGYYGYFGDAAGHPARGYYSYNLGTWHVVALNAVCDKVDCTAGGAQEQWLRRDLAANPARCTLALLHEPRFSSGSIHGGTTDVQPLWEALHDYGADVAFSGDDHLYERFQPQSPGGSLDTAHGIAQFVIGTGGYYLYDFAPTIEPNSAARIKSYGVLKATLGPDAAEYRFLRTDGDAATDSGSEACREPAQPPPPPPPDTVAPDTTLAGGPFDVTTSTSASFSFDANEPESSFECRLDQASWAACEPPEQVSGLEDGPHSFAVRAVDAFGNVDATPATHSWTVETSPPPDTTPPDTTITAAPPASGQTTSASFSFTATEQGSSFECRLDDGEWAACASPHALTRVPVGAHTFRVRAIDPAGNADPSAAEHGWTVEPPPPPYPDEVLADAPRAYWRLGEAAGLSAADVLGATPGVYQGGVVLGVPGALPAHADTAARFDGGNDQVNAGDPANGSLDFGAHDFTVEVWVKASANDERGIVSKRQPLAGTPYWQATVTDDGSKAGRVRVNVSDTVVSREVYGPAIRVDDGAWHHVAIVFERSAGIVIYVDGTSAVNAGAVAGDIGNAGPLLAGKVTGYAYYKGELDEVALYPRALSASRVRAHHAAGRFAG